MNTEIRSGTISFIHHKKQYCTIEYLVNGKKKTINGNIAERAQLKLLKENLIKSVHRFLIGDEVKFVIVKTAIGDKIMADRIHYLFNNALNNLTQKAKTENRFVGYLKLAGNNFFIKEAGSYLLFPLKLSLWEKKPDIKNLDEPFLFKLENLHNPEKVVAALFKPSYIPAFLKAQQLFKNKTPINAKVYNITRFATYVNIIDDQIRAKITLPEKENTKPGCKIGDTIKVIIIFLSNTKIVVEKV